MDDNIYIRHRILFCLFIYLFVYCFYVLLIAFFRIYWQSIDDESRSDTVHVQALQILDEWSVLLLQEPIDPNEIISKLIQKVRNNVISFQLKR